MTSKKELQLAFGVAIILLVLGVIGYAAFPPEQPPEPIRTMYHSAAGKVLFTHQKHTAVTGYSIDCYTCHHHPSSGDDTRSCGECHVKIEGGISETCMECHQNEEHDMLEYSEKKGVRYIPVETCLECHEDEFEGLPPAPRAESYHGQCMGCHKENEAGPQDCNECHIKS